MWKTMTAEWPAYDDYQKRPSADPVVVLERSRLAPGIRAAPR